MIFKTNVILPINFRITAIWGEWGAWNNCSKTCGTGTQNRVRECVNPNFPNVSCDEGLASQLQHCNERQCRKFPLHIFHVP